MPKVELLLPAGSLAIAKAAIDNGADAVYVGAQSFSARARAANLSEDEFVELIAYAHDRHTKVFCALNILIYNEEWESCIKLVTILVHAGVDAFIVQDFGIATMLISLFPETETHASTQMAIMNADGAAACKAIGFDRVVLARETSLDTIRQIRHSVDIDLEVFVQGALCMSYSGLCYMSASKGDRSGNRGQCAQPCRERYKLEDVNRKVLAEGYLLSPKDLCLADALPDLVHAGVASLKVEGRMKQQEYVVQAARSYRHLLDAVLAGEDHAETADERKKMAGVFNREGFTSGYLHGYPGKNMLSLHTPKNSGLEIGKILSIDSHRCKIRVSDDLHTGDGLALLDDSLSPVWGGYLDHLQDESGKDVKTVRAGHVACFSHGLTDASAYKHIKEVRRTFDKDLSKALLKPIGQKQEVHGQIDFTVHAVAGKPFWLEARLTDLEGRQLVRPWQSDFIVQSAKNGLSCAELVNTCLSKVTFAGFTKGSIHLEEPQPAFIPMSVINGGKRILFELFSQAKDLEQKERRTCDAFDVKERQEAAFELLDMIPPRISVDRTPALVVQVRTRAQAYAAIEGGADALNVLLLDSHRHDGLSLEELISLSGKTELTVTLPPVIKDEGEKQSFAEKIKNLIDHGLSRFMISNLGQAMLLDELGIENYGGDYTLNVFNDLSAFSYNQIGLDRITLSTEMDVSHMEKMSAIGNIPTEMIIYGKLPVMHTRYCPMGSLIGGRDEHSGCAMPCIQKQYKLTHNDKAYPVFTDNFCTTYLLNGQTLNLFPYLDHIVQLGLDAVRINGAFLDADEIKWAVSSAKTAISARVSSGSRYPGATLTSGHYLKGVR